jgi:hypothetical protein
MFLGTYAEVQKATVSFVMSVCPSVCPSARNNSALTEQICIKFVFHYFSKIYKENLIWIKI